MENKDINLEELRKLSIADLYAIRTSLEKSHGGGPTEVLNLLTYPGNEDKLKIHKAITNELLRRNKILFPCIDR